MPSASPAAVAHASATLRYGVYAAHPEIYFPWNLGLRFSAKAVAASRWSSVLKLIISYAIDASRIRLTCCLSHLFTASLVHRIAQVGPSANSRAISLALDSTWSPGTAWLTSPILAASDPLMNVPRIRNSLARAGPTRSGQITAPLSPATIPTLTWV